MGLQNEVEGIVEVIHFNPSILLHSPCGDPTTSCSMNSTVQWKHLFVSSHGGHVASEYLNMQLGTESLIMTVKLVENKDFATSACG